MSYLSQAKNKNTSIKGKIILQSLIFSILPISNVNCGAGGCFTIATQQKGAHTAAVETLGLDTVDAKNQNAQPITVTALAEQQTKDNNSATQPTVEQESDEALAGQAEEKLIQNANAQSTKEGQNAQIEVLDDAKKAKIASIKEAINKGVSIAVNIGLQMKLNEKFTKANDAAELEALQNEVTMTAEEREKIALLQKDIIDVLCGFKFTLVHIEFEKLIMAKGINVEKLEILKTEAMKECIREYIYYVNEREIQERLSGEFSKVLDEVAAAADIGGLVELYERVRLIDYICGGIIVLDCIRLGCIKDEEARMMLDDRLKTVVMDNVSNDIKIKKLKELKGKLKIIIDIVSHVCRLYLEEGVIKRKISTELMSIITSGCDSRALKELRRKADLIASINDKISYIQCEEIQNTLMNNLREAVIADAGNSIKILQALRRRVRTILHISEQISYFIGVTDQEKFIGKLQEAIDDAGKLKKLKRAIYEYVIAHRHLVMRYMNTQSCGA